MKTLQISRGSAVVGLLLTVFLLPVAARAAEISMAQVANPIKVLTMDEALAIASEKNRDIEKAREYIAWARGKYVEERAAALPQLTAIGALGLDRDESQKIYGPTMAERTDRRSGQIVLTQPLFTWGQVNAAIGAAKVGLLSADEQLRLYRQAARRDVAAAYYDVLLAREFQVLAIQNLEQKKRHLEESRRRYAAGVATDYDILVAEVSVDNARPETIRMENQVRTTRERLRFLLALSEEIDVTGRMEAVIRPTRNVEEAITLAHRKRPDLADLRYRIGIYEEQVVLASAQDKPRIDLKGAYGWNYLDQADARGDGASWSVGVHLTYPFFDGFRTAGRVAQAKSELRSLRIDEAKQVERVALEARDAVNSVRESEEILNALSGTVVQAERLLAMAEKGYELGVKIRLEVEDAELNLRQVKSNLSRARRDYLIAQVNLDWVTGILGE
jgi:HAE1 family hydrophobic/amphiphilic exporter-1